MTDPDHLVIALDDEPTVLTSLQRLLSGHGHPLRTHLTADDFFAAGLPAVPACLLLDHQLGNDVTGLDVHAEMKRRHWDIPTIFLTAHWDVPLVVSAMRKGADGFLTKPYDPDELLKEISRALDHARSLAKEGGKLSALQTRAATLTPRERQVVDLVAQGLLNKEIADHLKLALITVKVHRGRAMRKLGAGNAAELGRIAAKAGIFKPQ